MKFENFFNSKFFKFFELLYRLIVINLVGLLSILLGIGIFSLMSAFVSMIIILKSLNSNTDFPIINVFFNSFKRNFKKIILLSLFYYVIIFLALFNIYFFYIGYKEYGSIFYDIGISISFIIFILVIAAFINSCFVFVYFPNLSRMKIIKYSFYLFRIIPISLIIIFVFIVLGGILLYIIPILFIFIYLALGLYLINFSIRPIYNRLVIDGVESLNAFMYK